MVNILCDLIVRMYILKKYYCNIIVISQYLL